MSTPRARLALPAASVLVARDFEGIEEDPENRGPTVEFFQRVAGIDPGQAWCAAFVFAVSEIAAAMKNVRNPLLGVPLKGYVQSYFEWAQKWDRLVEAGEAGVGDLFALWFPSKDRYAHIGFVSTPPGEARAIYHTVEGNSNEEGQREGIKVLRRQRDVTQGTAFIRWAD